MYLRPTIYNISFVWGVILFIFLLSCSAPEPATKSQPASDGDNAPQNEERIDKPAKEAESFSIGNYRNTLGDTYSSRQHEIPEEFITYRQAETKNEENSSNGYRIQLISSRNVAKADSVHQAFNQWVDSLEIDYKPSSYIIFRQPYFRVRVGDFSSRQRAIENSRWIKRQFPDAWVVHDIINPARRPDVISARRDTTANEAVADTTRQNN